MILLGLIGLKRQSDVSKAKGAKIFMKISSISYSSD